ncbi:uncharacterized protein CC84DRAFT_939555 [Paraphaeosphaeria sporulosa]|uniref:Uncharacterized protein n=1 Tax=Paraphaeosphaeria sporulosa TaxID=1460663 RepID=A0A177C8H7_9PLEO|nr:uncharacterized protein CC84DRAFT_939555 [Paraphaeosphaeria sporulosa]OAG03010.1 hypothetical protein CC84DRAFT_939555 [Paraphaeosphaeria sporulosa]
MRCATHSGCLPAAACPNGISQYTSRSAGSRWESSQMSNRAITDPPGAKSTRWQNEVAPGLPNHQYSGKWTPRFGEFASCTWKMCADDIREVVGGCWEGLGLYVDLHRIGNISWLHVDNPTRHISHLSSPFRGLRSVGKPQECPRAVLKHILARLHSLWIHEKQCDFQKDAITPIASRTVSPHPVHGPLKPLRVLQTAGSEPGISHRVTSRMRAHARDVKELVLTSSGYICSHTSFASTPLCAKYPTKAYIAPIDILYHFEHMPDVEVLLRRVLPKTISAQRTSVP